MDWSNPVHVLAMWLLGVGIAGVLGLICLVVIAGLTII